MNGPGEVLHAFDAEAGEELSVYAGEEVRLMSQHWEDPRQKFPCRCQRDKRLYTQATPICRKPGLLLAPVKSGPSVGMSPTRPA